VWVVIWSSTCSTPITLCGVENIADLPVLGVGERLKVRLHHLLHECARITSELNYLNVRVFRGRIVPEANYNEGMVQ
jgi:hypothetical protein